MAVRLELTDSERKASRLAKLGVSGVSLPARIPTPTLDLWWRV